ncbi:MAG: hypothetical protein CVU06_02915 [Bacteroidetes bacterium HGW-Bacteroidetes-22]|nr:MAG: hypothetical protein CVU06_02915 [Bacteroidetes bacterium HGW-Bacteroidetes-22]
MLRSVTTGFNHHVERGEELLRLQGTKPQSAQQQPKLKLSWIEVCCQRLGFDPERCPCSKKGKMHIIRLLKPRSPPHFTDCTIKRQDGHCKSIAPEYLRQFGSFKAKPMQLLNPFPRCRLLCAESENFAFRSLKKVKTRSFIALLYQNQIN